MTHVVSAEIHAFAVPRPDPAGAVVHDGDPTDIRTGA